jgi:hypothetical protein
MNGAVIAVQLAGALGRRTDMESATTAAHARLSAETQITAVSPTVTARRAVEAPLQPVQYRKSATSDDAAPAAPYMPSLDAMPAFIDTAARARADSAVRVRLRSVRST